MSYTSNTFNSENDPSKRTAGERFTQELGLILGILVLAFWLISLLSYTTQDAAWSTTGVDSLTRNWGGRLGAYVSDASYFFFGFSVWWLVLALGYVWLTHLAKWLRHDDRAGSPTKSLKANAITLSAGDGQMLTPEFVFGWACCCWWAVASPLNGRDCNGLKHIYRVFQAVFWVTNWEYSAPKCWGSRALHWHAFV